MYDVHGLIFISINLTDPTIVCRGYNFISDQLFEDHIIPSISISAFCIDFNHL
jgi:hypothetical protein